MTNSISLSSDMNKLLFTSSSGTSEIALSGNGVLLYIKNEAIIAEPASVPLSGSGIVESIGNAQWTLTFNEANQIFFFIGITELDTNLKGMYHIFEMAGQKLNIRLIESNLIAVAATV